MSPSLDKKKLLSTSSPEGIQVASKITPARLASLLMRKGPLPIRHITSQLSLEVPSFDSLSLSKQRRLIMSAMEQPDIGSNVVFEKIGWGQWAVRNVDSDFIVTEGSEAATAPPGAPRGTTETDTNMPSPRVKTGATKSTKVAPTGWARRQSITNHKTNLHNTTVPGENYSVPENYDITQNYSLEDAIVSDSDDVMDSESESESGSESESESEDELFTFDEEKKGPIKFAGRVPVTESSPEILPDELLSHPLRVALKHRVSSPQKDGPKDARRRKSSSYLPSPINKPSYRHQIFNRSRLNSLDNLDNYIISSAKNSTLSINSPPSHHAQVGPGYNSGLSSSPVGSWSGTNYIHTPDGVINRRKSSFNESHLRSTLGNAMGSNPPAVLANPLVAIPSVLSSSLPAPNATLPVLNGTSNPYTQRLSPPYTQHLSHPYTSPQNSTSTPSVTKPHRKFRSYSNSAGGHQSDTDEEDWATMGAESLRRQQMKRTPRSPVKNTPKSRSQSRSRPPLPRSQSRLSRVGDLNDEETTAAIALVDLKSI